MLCMSGRLSKYKGLEAEAKKWKAVLEELETQQMESEEFRSKFLAEKNKHEEVRRDCSKALEKLKKIQEDISCIRNEPKDECEIIQISVQLDTPPEKEWEESHMEQANELANARKDLFASVKRVQELEAKVSKLESELKDQKEIQNSQSIRNKLEMKERDVMVEIANNSIKKLRLDIRKLKSSLDQKNMETAKLKDIINKLEEEKDNYSIIVTLRCN
eukprot:TRINITY_DN7519_c0_g2_i1.p2 TRINITY_DN7519_c0_g2~~TRINITY_DN7519_c0_g2_i1.p2  ORF type:complete len:217 (-),score=59.62 TRINITY_DN7519_c0_g2_i1:868-1518(-)